MYLLYGSIWENWMIWGLPYVGNDLGVFWEMATDLFGEIYMGNLGEIHGTYLGTWEIYAKYMGNLDDDWGFP